jgi:hypothetical protein
MTGRRAIAAAICAVCLLPGCALWSGGSDSLTGLEDHTGSVQEIIDLMHAGKSDEALALLDSLHGAIVTLRSELRGLRLVGEHNMLSDPLTLPAGTYRVHFATEGHAFVDVYDMQGNDLKTLFTVGTGDASGGASTLFTSTGQQVLVEISWTSAPYTLVFERL